MSILSASKRVKRSICRIFLVIHGICVDFFLLSGHVIVSEAVKRLDIEATKCECRLTAITAHGAVLQKRGKVKSLAVGRHRVMQHNSKLPSH
jgi:hypothetical protein